MVVSLRKKRFGISDIFSDFNIEFEVEGDDLKKDKDVAAIMNSLRNIIYTNQGERPMDNIDLGTTLQWHLFEPIDNETLRILGENLVRAIEDQEPRVEVVNLDMDPIESTADSNRISGRLTVRILNFAERDTFVLRFYLDI